MTTVQIIGVSVAAAAVLLLIIALIVTRRRGDDDEQDETRPGPSFLDEAPQDTFSALGRAEQPIEDITLRPLRWSARPPPSAPRAAAVRRTRGSRSPAVSGSTGARTSACASWRPSRAQRPPGTMRRRSPGAPAGDETEITGELRPRR